MCAIDRDNFQSIEEKKKKKQRKKRKKDSNISPSQI